MDLVIGLAAAVVVATGVCAAMIRLGPVMGFVDLPDGYLKSHKTPAVPLGGIGVFAAVHVGLAIVGEFNTGLLIASSMLLVLGLMDDYRELGPLMRLVIEVFAGAVLAVGSDLPSIPDGPLSILMVTAIVVLTVNAVNLLDGLDGLAAGSAAVTAVGIAALAAVRGLEGDFGVILTAALAGFLILNWHPAKVFLGDNGAYTVAVFLVYGLLVATPAEAEARVLVATGLLGVFAVDLAVTLLRRWLNDKPLFAGDRSHVYDQLVDRGWSIPGVALVFAAAQATIGVVVIVTDELVSPPVALAILAVVLGSILLALARAGFLREQR